MLSNGKKIERERGEGKRLTAPPFVVVGARAATPGENGVMYPSRTPVRMMMISAIRIISREIVFFS
jgi:hypothetical protein